MENKDNTSINDLNKSGFLLSFGNSQPIVNERKKCCGDCKGTGACNDNKIKTDNSESFSDIAAGK